MRKILIYTVLILASYVSYAQESADRTMYFVQNGDTIQPDSNGTVTLSKAAFEIRMSLRDNDVVISNLGMDPSNKEAIENGIPKDSLACFGMGTGMSDYPNNSKKSLLVKSTDNSYWPYVSKFNRSRFDKTEEQDGIIQATRTVEVLNFLEADLKGDFSVADCPVDRLYLIHFTNYDNTEGKRSRTQPVTLTLVFQ